MGAQPNGNPFRISLTWWKSVRKHVFVREKPDWPHLRAALEAGEESDAPALEAWRGRSYSQREVSRCARSAAAFLKRQGVGKGDKIALFGENSPEWVIAWFAVRLLRAAAVPLDSQLGPEGVSAFASFAEVKLVFADGPRREVLEKSQASFRIAPLEREHPEFEEVFNGEPLPWSELPEPDPNDLAAVIFTSGTTGDPKGVELTESNLLGNAQTLARLGIENENDVMGTVLPLHHVYAFTVGMLTPFLIRAPVIFPGTMKGDLLRKCLAEKEITILPAVPLLLELMVEGIERNLSAKPFPVRLLLRAAGKLSRLTRKAGLPFGRLLLAPVRRRIGPRLRLIVSAGAALPAQINETLLDLGFTVVEGYGLTETSPAVAITPPEAPRPGSVGLPIPGAEFRIGERRPDGSGEVLVRGPMVMRGYHKRPDLTSEAFLDGFFRTGDLGKFDGDGYLWITGRVKEVIVLPSGKNIYPEEVERHYLNSEIIKEICVVEDPEKGECLHALIVPEERVLRESGEDAADLIRFDLEDLSKRLPSYQRIGGFTVTTEPLPRTRLGKLKRGEIARLLAELRKGKRKEKPLSEEEKEFLDSQAGRAIMEVLSEAAGRPVRPSEHLEIDVGLDSLKRLEVLVRIEETLGVTVDPERFAEVARPIDLAPLVAEEAQGARKKEEVGEGKAFSWSTLFETEPDPPLERIVAVRSGPGTAAVRAAGWLLLRSYLGLFFGLEVKGAENLPRERCIVSPNHVSLIDAPVIFVALPSRLRGKICFFGARSQFRSLFRRFLVKPARVILTDQILGGRQALVYGASALRRGLSLCIFPEGRRSPTGRLEPARPGAGLLAREFRVPVVPVLIRGTESVWSRIPDPPPRRRIRVVFGEPMPPERFLSVEREEDLGRPWEEAIRRLQEPP